MGITDTSGHFNTKVARKMLDEYDNDYLQHDRQLAAIATQTCAIIKDAARLYEENDVLYETVGKLSSTLSERIMELEAENAKLRDLAINCYRMAKVHCTDRDCYARCSHWPECYERDTIEHVEPCELSVIAQELGIEVDA